MSTLDRAEAIIAKIAAAGGPPPEYAAKYHEIRAVVREAQSSGEDLGVITPMALLLYGGVTGILAWLTVVAIKTEAAASAAAKSLYWMGAAWVGYQLYKLR